MSIFDREPMISLAFHEATCAQHRADMDRERGYHAAYADQADARYDALLEKFTALRVQGAVSEPKPLTFTSTLDAAPPDELKALIHERSGKNYRLRSMMLAQLAADRAQGVDDGKIRDAIERGVSSDGVPV